MKDKYKTLMIGYIYALGVCVVFRLLGYSFNTLTSDYDWFINLCKFIDTKVIIQACIKYVVFTTSTTIFLQGIIGVKKFERKHWGIIVTICLLEIVRFVFAEYLFVTMPIDLFITIGIPIIYNKKLWLKAIISTVALIMFEIISGFIKQIDRTNIDYTLQGLIASIEYYIMIFFYKNLCLEIKFNNNERKSKIWEKSGFYF